ncbi:FAD-dependent oxidoreductase [Pengzhenrongella sicca]|uniref:FAD-dependent oxidoreductase n=1 Tax=Pengzhenrongella sicca TaxID=2819238 RepID=A0A8A4ZJX7_9MICO|nr:FAD-dependent oxidoreductase [Pengzhenrongella sicca]QTE30816.1 FAD-dependent oxidoreductase [Pengzhenrongella sicca]
MTDKSVVVVGGGYGGAKVAKLLDDVADVTLVEPKDAFVHSTGALRAAVDPAWEDRVFFPYDHLLARGRVVHEHAQAVGPHRVQLSATGALDADYLVLATGTAYPFPAKFIESESHLARARLARLRGVLAGADRALLVGAGPVGLELAGELSAAYPDLGITIVDQADDVLTTWDYQPELRASIRAQLEARGVVFELGSPLGYLPPQDVGEPGEFTVHTRAGGEVSGQVWFRCHGNLPVLDYLGPELAAARVGDGGLEVTGALTVVGFDTVFAIGDVTTIRESKRASAALAHAEVAAANIRALIEGREPTATYAPAPEIIVLPLGPDGGGSQLVGDDGERRILGPEQTSELKGADLHTGVLTELFGRPAAS